MQESVRETSVDIINVYKWCWQGFK